MKGTLGVSDSHSRMENARLSARTNWQNDVYQLDKLLPHTLIELSS